MKDIWEEAERHNPLKLNEDKSITLEFNGIKINQVISSKVYEIVYKILTELRRMKRVKQCIYE